MDKDFRISVAVVELTEAYDFIIHLTEISREQTMAEVTARDPSFIEHDREERILHRVTCTSGHILQCGLLASSERNTITFERK